jgi:hypothetical protein
VVRPNLEVTVQGGADRIHLDIWVMARGGWIGRVRGEETGVALNELELRVLLTRFDDLWDHRLFFDSARRVERLAWQIEGYPTLALARDLRVPDGWFLEVPGPKETTRTVAADPQACHDLIQELLRVELDGLDPAGTSLKDAGLAPPAGYLHLHFSGGGGKQHFRIGTIRKKLVPLCRDREPETVFLLQAAKLSLLPRSALDLVDRTPYRGDWRRINELDIHCGADERYRFRNVGQSEARHWQRTDVSETPRQPEGFVAGTPMRQLSTFLTEKLRADTVLAWNRENAPAAWGVDQPRFRIVFRDTSPARRRFIQMAVGQPQEDRSGRTWYPMWLEGEALSERPYVYKINDELVRWLQAVLPDD